MARGGGQVENPSLKRQWIYDVFFNKDIQGIQTFHNDAIIISMIITNNDIEKILIDNGSSIAILFYDAFQRMKL